SSRPPAAGSIAAEQPRRAVVARVSLIPPTSGGLHCGLLWGGVVLLEFVSSRPPAAGSIAARSASVGHDPGRSLIPPTSGGLHCGNLTGQTADAAGSSHPAPQRRGPL